MKVDLKPIVIAKLGIISEKFVKSSGRIRNQRTTGDHPDNSIIKIGQNSEKRQEGSRRLGVTQTSEIYNHLTLA